MSDTIFSKSFIPCRYSYSFLAALIAGGLAGNYCKFPFFLNIDFLFGSIFAMLALLFFGISRGITAGALIAGYTYILWNHPYAIIIMTAEVAVVGWLMSRRKIGMVIADTLYWLFIGMPMVYLFYQIVMHLPHSTTYMMMIKQAINGIANALIASLIYTGYSLRTRSSLTTYREIVYNLLAFFVLYPALVMLALSGRADFMDTDHHIRSTLTSASNRLNHYTKTWLSNRKSSIINLAEMAESTTPQQMQSFLEQTKKSDMNFPRVGLLDKSATTIAYTPLVDELGKSTIGISAADRPYLPQLKQSLRPMLSEVVMGKIGILKPRVFMLAPVVSRGEYNGYVVGVLDLEQIWEQLDKSLTENATYFTLLDKNGNIIMTNRSDQKVMTPFVRGKGTLNHLDKTISQWVPTLLANTSIAERWSKSYYVVETDIGDLSEWKLILEQPVAPFQKKLYTEYTGKLILLFLIMIGSLGLAEFLSRRFFVTLDDLRSLTHELPLKLASKSEEIIWPVSGINEANHLINNFKEMADSLSLQFREIRHINESLEQRVAERTEKLRIAEQFVTDILDSLLSSVAVLDIDGAIVAVNAPWRKFASVNGAGKSVSSDIGDNYLTVCRDSIDAGDESAEAALTGISAVLSGQQEMFTLEYPCHSPYEKHWFSMTVLRMQGSRNGVVISHTNISERKRLEEDLHRSMIRFRSIIEASPVPQALNDENLNITFLNPAFIKTFGYTLDDIPTLIEWWEQAYPDPDYRQRINRDWSRNLAKAKSDGTDFEPFEVQIQCKDGKSKTVLASAAPLEINYNGEHLIILFDITERKQIENALHESKRFLDGVIDQSPINMWVSEALQCLTWVEHKAC